MNQPREFRLGLNPMRILLVTATKMEGALIAARLGQRSRTSACLDSYTYRQHHLDMLTTGVGMVATAAWCSRRLTQNRYDLALNFGVCGSFDPALELAQVVHVVSDCLPELGAEDDQSFLTAQQLKLIDENEFPFLSGRLTNLHPPAHATISKLTVVHGITVNTVHGNQASIASVVKQFKPQVESMEGAAFMYACLIHQVDFAQVRAISNRVEKRNREAWKLNEAL